MDVKKLEALIEAQRADLTALSSTVETLAGTVAALVESSVTATTFAALVDRCQILEDAMNDVQGALNGWEVGEEGVPEDETAEQRATRVGLVTRLNEIEVLVRGRNTSAPVKRNMTDADAVEVLTGSAAGLEHKEAAEKLGLTYAQVYSCRLEYTFKHVLKQLREQGFKNPWAKK